MLLVLADLTSEKCFAVCLNDYIDKILASLNTRTTPQPGRVLSTFQCATN